jgi:hypothetical protein
VRSNFSSASSWLFWLEINDNKWDPQKIRPKAETEKQETNQKFFCPVASMVPAPVPASPYQLQPGSDFLSCFSAYPCNSNFLENVVMVCMPVLYRFMRMGSAWVNK